MRFLLDTHCWLWWLFEPEKLSDTAQATIRNKNNQLYLSVASIWEIGIKVKIGKLNISQPLEIFIPQQMQADGLEALLITPNHAIKAANLPLHHKDPFDQPFDRKNAVRINRDIR